THSCASALRRTRSLSDSARIARATSTGVLSTVTMARRLRSVKRSIVSYALRKADRGHQARNFSAASALERRARILARSRHEDRPMEDDIAKMRAWYARELQLTAPVRRNMAIVEAFAVVPRELFLGPGPWRTISDPIPNESFTTPDDDR